jgi:hypothetical protein
MHTRRVASFLLGIWIGCGLLMGLIAVQNLRSPALILTSPSDQATQIMKKLTPEESQLLLRYQAVEQNRRYLFLWEEIELGLALVLSACLFLGTQKRIFPQVLCAMMFVLVLFEHFAITPEMNYRGREADFPPGNRSFGAQARVWALDEVYLAAEGAKLVLGGILASYLFVFRTKRRARMPDDAAGSPDPSHAAGRLEG